MPKILTQTWGTIIPDMPIGKHSAEIRPALWETPPLTKAHYKTIFPGNKPVRISRERLLRNVYSDNELKCIEILMWGYPSGGREHLRANFLKNLKCIAKLATAETDWMDYYKNLKLKGLGISTITKLAYFFNKKFESKQSLIIDSRVIQVLNSSRWEELSMPGITYDNAHKHYLEYLTKCDGIAREMKCRADQIEFFLFFMGNSF